MPLRVTLHRLSKFLITRNCAFETEVLLDQISECTDNPLKNLHLRQRKQYSKQSIACII